MKLIMMDSKKLIIFMISALSMNLGWATNSEIKEKVNQATETFRKGIEKCGDKVDDIQQYLRNYDYKGVIKDYVVSGPATVHHLTLNGDNRAVVVRPGERIEGIIKYKIDKERCKDIKYHRLLIGYKNLGPQTTVAAGLGYITDKENENRFTLVAPQKPGLYQIRFRSVENFTETEALKHWTDEDGNEPSIKKTIGIVVVKS